MFQLTSNKWKEYLLTNSYDHIDTLEVQMSNSHHNPGTIQKGI